MSTTFREDLSKPYRGPVGLLGRGSVSRKAATYTRPQKHKNKRKHPHLEWNSNARPQCFEMAKTVQP
jgi:hypothetical protein